MTPSKFDSRIRRVMAEKHAWFESVEPPVAEDEVKKVESRLGRALPSQYKHFSLTFGGGYFGGVNISTLDEGSDWYVLARPTVKVARKTILIVADDEAGGVFGFMPSDGGFESRVIYVNPGDGNSLETASASFFEFIEKFALNF